MNYFSAIDAKKTADRAVVSAIERQKRRVFNAIRIQADRRCYQCYFYPREDEGCLYREVYNALKECGYIVDTSAEPDYWIIKWNAGQPITNEGYRI